MKQDILITQIKRGILGIAVLLFLTSCELWENDIERWKPESEELVISDYIEQFDIALYSEFDTLLKSTELNSLLKIRGPFTVFLPTDSAVHLYCEEKGIGSLIDLDMESQKALVYTHLIQALVFSDDIGLGAISEVNGLNDRIATEFVGSDIYLNRVSKISNRDIIAANGVIHEIDRVIDPLEKNIYELISENPDYSIFTKGLELSGIKDTLAIIEFEYGTKIARTEFTFFAVTDTTYQRFGINNIDDLINECTDDKSDLKSEDNGFYQYMEYHCLNGSFYFSDFESKLYPILSYNNNVLVKFEDNQFKINPTSTVISNDDTTYVLDTYSTLYLEQSNLPAKNGVLHTINHYLPVVLPEPTEILWEVTDYFDIKQGDYYGKYYYKWFDGENDLEYVKWGGDFLQYYKKGSPMNGDALQMFGYFWIEITTPKIMKGNYNLMSKLVFGVMDHEVWVDGVKTATIKDAESGDLDYGNFYWDKTERHTVRIENTAWGMLFWDYLTFIPLVE